MYQADGKLSQGDMTNACIDRIESGCAFSFLGRGNASSLLLFAFMRPVGFNELDDNWKARPRNVTSTTRIFETRSSHSGII